MLAKLRALRLLLVALLVAGALTVALSPKPAGAYYGEVEGYASFAGGYVGSSTQGCKMELFVLYGGMGVQPYCYFHSGHSGVYVGKTNFHEYRCWNWDGCTFTIFIPAMGAPWHPVGCYHLKKTDNWQQHAIIMRCWPASF
jgi:hypothetical protein